MTQAQATADDDLVLRWKAGVPGAAQALSRAHFPLVFRFFDLNAADAAVDDLVQETFVAALEARDRFEPERATFRAFILGIARNKLLKWRTRTQRTATRMQSLRSTAQRSAGSPSGVAALREELRLLLDALQTLPLRQQLVLQLHYWEGLRTEEIATVLGIAGGTVRSRLLRARDSLKSAILAADAADALKRATTGGLDRWAAALRALLK